MDELEFDSRDIEDTRKLEQQKANEIAKEISRVWYPFAKVCLSMIVYKLLDYAKKVKLTNELILKSIDHPSYELQGIYQFELLYKHKCILRVGVKTEHGYTTNPISYGFTYHGSSSDPDPIAWPVVDDPRTFYFDPTYTEQIKEAYHIMKEQIKAAQSERLQTADTTKAFHDLTFNEAVETLQILSEAMDLLIEVRQTRLTEMKVSSLASTLLDPRRCAILAADSAKYLAGVYSGSVTKDDGSKFESRHEVLSSILTALEQQSNGGVVISSTGAPVIRTANLPQDGNLRVAEKEQHKQQIVDVLDYLKQADLDAWNMAVDVTNAHPSAGRSGIEAVKQNYQSIRDLRRA